MLQGYVQTVDRVSYLLWKNLILDETTFLPLHNNQWNLCSDIVLLYNQDIIYKWTMIKITEAPPHQFDLKWRFLDNPKHILVIYGIFFEGDISSE